jgi:heme-degrading monooxygenase HmoA
MARVLVTVPDPLVVAARLCSNGYVYMRVWEYQVDADHTDAFVAAYGQDGEWAQLFRTSQGFVGTELYRGTDDPARFVTVDRWSDHGAWRGFLEESLETYAGLDKALAHLSASQHCLLEGPD